MYKEYANIPTPTTECYKNRTVKMEMKYKMKNSTRFQYGYQIVSFLKKMGQKRKITEEDNVLDRFTNPEKKEKRNQQKKKKLKILHEQNLMAGKEFAVEHFNNPMSVTDKLFLKDQVTKVVTIEEVQKLLTATNEGSIGYTPANVNKKGIVCVFEFIVCARKCQTWLNEQMVIIGWKQNMTNYDPITVSHSPRELIGAVMECFRMACKQMLRYLEISEVC
jgi:hypothetical protein